LNAGQNWNIKGVRLAMGGVAKVTGRAKYAAEFEVPNLACGFIVQSAIARGTIKSIDAQAAESAPGVLRVFTHQNVPPLPKEDTNKNPIYGQRRDLSFKALHTDKVSFNGQPVALVVAETFEQARHAARLVDEEKPTTNKVDPDLGTV
jgi:xanthine dehydrogenase YagR molybdenum-binding subunit